MLTSPLDSGISISAKIFKVIDEKFIFNNPISVKDFSGTYVYISYENAKEIFPLSVPHIVINHELLIRELQNIRNDIVNANVVSWQGKNPLFFAAIKVEKLLYTTLVL